MENTQKKVRYLIKSRQAGATHTHRSLAGTAHLRSDLRSLKGGGGGGGGEAGGEVPVLVRVAHLTHVPWSTGPFFGGPPEAALNGRVKVVVVVVGGRWREGRLT